MKGKNPLTRRDKPDFNNEGLAPYRTDSVTEPVYQQAGADVFSPSSPATRSKNKNQRGIRNAVYVGGKFICVLLKIWLILLGSCHCPFHAADPISTSSGSPDAHHQDCHDDIVTILYGDAGYPGGLSRVYLYQVELRASDTVIIRAILNVASD